MIISISGCIGVGKDTVANMIQYLLYKDNFDGDGLDNISLKEFINCPQRKKNNLSGFLVKRFADEIKDTVCRWIGCTREQLENRGFKEKPLGEEWHVWKVTYAPSGAERIFSTEQERDDFFQNKSFQKKEDCVLTDYRLTPRKLMQLLGTEAGRQIIHPDIWVNALFTDYDSHPKSVKQNWIIPDTRFPNELERVSKYDGLKIRVERKTELRFPDLWSSYQKSNCQEWDTWLRSHDREMYKKIYHKSETALDQYDDWDCVIYNNFSLETLLKVVKEILTKENLI